MLKALLVLMMASLTVGFGVVAWLSLRPAPAPAVAEAAAPPPPATLAVLSASRPVAAGTLLKPDDLATLTVPADAVPEGARADTPVNRAALAGALVLHNIAAQQPVLPADVLRPADGGFLAAVLRPGHRAVSVAVDAVSGTAGLIWPGDRVDLILTQTLDDQAAPIGRRTLGETVLTDLRVIAVDQQLAQAAGPDVPAGQRTVTLSVLPEQAERIAVAVRLGRIALSVRPADRPEMLDRLVASPAEELTGTSPAAPPTQALSLPARKEPSTTWGQDVSPGLIPRRAVAAPVTVRAYQGASSEKEFKFE